MNKVQFSVAFCAIPLSLFAHLLPLAFDFLIHSFFKLLNE